MAIHLLAGITVLLFLLIMGISFLLFGREWLRARREEAFSRNLDRHSGLSSRLRTTSGEEFDVGGSSTDGSWMIRLTHFRTDDDRIWAYFARGAEGYTTGTVDQIGNISSNTFGLGGRTFPAPLWGIEGNVEWQDREGGNDYFTVTALALRRF
jgi:hypothetical protein